MGFNAFTFLNNRIEKLPLSDAEIGEFKAYNVLQSLSMDRRYIKIANGLNNTNFTKLPLELQAKMFKALGGMQVDNRWCRAKTEVLAARDAFINKVMVVYDMSHNSAWANVRADVIDRKYVEEAYDVIQAKYPKFRKGK